MAGTSTDSDRSLAAGLTSGEARRRRAEAGPNAIADERRAPWRIFLAKLWGPIPWLLEAAVLVELWRASYVAALLIAGLLMFNAILGFFEEGRAGAAVAALKERLTATALVRRDGNWVRLAASELVPGDAVRLPLGAIVPADATVVDGSVMVDQSMLTGESIPVEAAPGSRVYAGSIIRRGNAVAEITATGARTYFGRTAELVRIAHAASTEQAAIFAATRNLALVNGTVAILIVAYGYAAALPVGDLVRLALTSLLATIPVALPATFTLSAAFSAQMLARRGVLLTRLSAAHEAAAMDVLCSDKTGTLTENALEVLEVAPMAGFDRDRVLALAALASSEGDADPIDVAVRRAVTGAQAPVGMERPARVVPFDPTTQTSEAVIDDGEGHGTRVVKGAFAAIARMTEVPADARRRVDELAGLGHRIIAVALAGREPLRLAGLIALSDPPREDAASLIADLGGLGVRTVMVTGDSAVTAATIARKVGISGAVCPPAQISDEISIDAFGVFARVAPEQKYRLVKALQARGHVVGMCGDGVNDAPALRQAQIGIAVSTATDAAKTAAGMVLTQPGLASVVHAVREGRIGFQRLVTYTSNMLVKKIEVVLFLGIGLILTGQVILSPSLMVLLLMTNDFLSMSLTTDRPSPSPSPGVWRMRSITGGAVVFGICKLAFSTALLALGYFRLGLDIGKIQTLAFVTLALGNQAILYVLRERRRLWNSRPSNWILASSFVDIAIVSALAISGILMKPLPWPVVAAVLAASVAFALILDQVKRPILTALGK